MDPERVGVGWTTDTELLAAIAELLDVGNRYFVSANASKNTKLPEPLQIPRPYKTERKAKKQSSTEELKAFAGQTGGAIIKKTEDSA